jgi:hypothetical protein
MRKREACINGIFCKGTVFAGNPDIIPMETILKCPPPDSFTVCAGSKNGRSEKEQAKKLMKCVKKAPIILYLCRKLQSMRFFLKNSGIFVLFTGILFLIIPFFLHFQTNRSLLTGWILIVLGFVLFILLNKKIS